MALRFGLLGTGYWAAEVHAAGLAEHPDATLSGVWGRNPEKATALARRYGTEAFTDVDELLSGVDAVAVALPPGVQAPLARRAALAGKHLLLDKPLAYTVAEADAVCEAVAARGVASVIFFTRRFCVTVEDFLTQAAATGGWQGARMFQFSSIFFEGSPYATSQWRRERGGLWDIGPHALSMLLPVLGPVTRAFAVEGPGQTAYVTLWHAGGAVSTMALTVDAPRAASGFGTVFHGEAGLAEIPAVDIEPLTAYAHAISDLTGAATDNTPHRCDVRFGREVVAVLAAAQDSYRTGAPVPVG